MAGCAAINAGALSFAHVSPGANQRSTTGMFETGDKISLVLSRSTFQTVAIRLDALPSDKAENLDAADDASLSVTITGSASHTVISEISGDFESGVTVAVACTPTPAAALPTTTVLASSPNPSNDGQQVTLTATVTPSSASGTPTGNVVFTIDGSAQAPIALDGTGKGLLRTTSLSAGNHAVAARYVGSAAFLASTSPTVRQVVRPVSATTTTALASSRNPGATGESLTFTQP